MLISDSFYQLEHAIQRTGSTNENILPTISTSFVFGVEMFDTLEKTVHRFNFFAQKLKIWKNLIVNNLFLNFIYACIIIQHEPLVEYTLSESI